MPQPLPSKSFSSSSPSMVCSDSAIKLSHCDWIKLALDRENNAVFYECFEACRFTPGERAPRTHWIGGCVSPSVRLYDVEKRKFLPLSGPGLRPIGCSARSHSLSRLLAYNNIIILKNSVPSSEKTHCISITRLFRLFLFENEWNATGRSLKLSGLGEDASKEIGVVYTGRGHCPPSESR
jgi:hypothetical protein